MLLDEARALTDDALLAAARGLVGRERRLTAELVAHLAEIDTRALCQREGYSSLFAYCRDGLGLSEHEAYGRIEAARSARRFPFVLELLRDGAITFTTVGLLARHLTAENHREVLESARGKKKAEIEEIVARLQPVADVPAALRKLPDTTPTTAGSLTADSGTAPAPTVGVAVASARGLGQPALQVPVCIRSSAPVPLSPDRYKYQLTIDRETRDLLCEAKDLLRHAEPSGGDAVLLKRALRLLVADLARKKLGGATARPRNAPVRSGAPSVRSGDSFGPSCDATARSGEAKAASGGGSVEVSARSAGCSKRGVKSGSRHIPNHVKRAVFARDEGGCAFVSHSGRRCGERAFLEFHHLKAYAVGGEPDIGNIQLRCRRHNQYEARVYFARPDGEQGSPTGPVAAVDAQRAWTEVAPGVVWTGS